MTKKSYRKLIAGHLQWSVIGLIIALFVAFAASDHRSVVYGVPAAETNAPSTSPAPASAPQMPSKKVVPDTINGELVWPDPWDKITDSSPRNY